MEKMEILKMQKFKIGTCVYINVLKGQSRDNFPNHKIGIVQYTYGQVFSGNNFTSYCINITDGNYGCVSWYDENDLIQLHDGKFTEIDKLLHGIE